MSCVRRCMKPRGAHGGRSSRHAAASIGDTSLGVPRSQQSASVADERDAPRPSARSRRRCSAEDPVIQCTFLPLGSTLTDHQATSSVQIHTLGLTGLLFWGHSTLGWSSRNREHFYRLYAVPANSVKANRDRHPFNGLFSRTTCASRHQECLTNPDFNYAYSEYKHVLANILRSRYVARTPPVEARSPGRHSNVENAPRHPPVTGQQRAARTHPAERSHYVVILQDGRKLVTRVRVMLP